MHIALLPSDAQGNRHSSKLQRGLQLQSDAWCCASCSWTMMPMMPQRWRCLHSNRLSLRSSGSNTYQRAQCDSWRDPTALPILHVGCAHVSSRSVSQVTRSGAHGELCSARTVERGSLHRSSCRQTPEWCHIGPCHRRGATHLRISDRQARASSSEHRSRRTFQLHSMSYVRRVTYSNEFQCRASSRRASSCHLFDGEPGVEKARTNRDSSSSLSLSDDDDDEDDEESAASGVSSV